MKKTEKQYISNSFVGEAMTRIDHKSGLTVYIVKKDFASTYALFGTKYGSYDNVFTLNGEKVSVPSGIAHFLEHKMFETEDGTDSFELFAEIGADANAYTSVDRTVYLFSCTQDFIKGFEILLKMVTTPVFTDANVKKEQGIIAQEIKMCEDRPGDALHYNLMKALYEKNPVRIPIAGTVESISHITPELLYKCYNAFYRMNNMAVCICGNVDEDEILSVIDRVITAPEQESVVFEQIDEPAQVCTDRITAFSEISKPYFAIGIKYPEGNEKDKAVCDILCEAVLGNCEDMYSELFENDLVNSYNSYYDYCRACSYFCVCGDSDDPEKVLETVMRYIEDAASNGVSEQAFERAKRMIYAGVLKSFDSSENIAEGMFDAFAADLNFLSEADEYKNVTHLQVNELAKRVFTRERVAISTVCPKNEVKKEVSDNEQ